MDAPHMSDETLSALTWLWAIPVLWWLTHLPTRDLPLLAAQAVMVGLTAGILLAAWL